MQISHIIRARPERTSTMWRSDLFDAFHAGETFDDACILASVNCLTDAGALWDRGGRYAPSQRVRFGLTPASREQLPLDSDNSAGLDR